MSLTFVAFLVAFLLIGTLVGYTTAELSHVAEDLRHEDERTR